MNTEQERAEFEAWYRLHHGSLDYGRDASGEYADKQVQGAFNVWQARAALTAQPAASAEPVEGRKACPRGCGEAIGHAAVCSSLGDKQTDPVLRAALWDAAALLYEQATQIKRLEEALDLLPDEIVMVEHNPYEGPLMFCCGQRVTLSWHHDLIPTHDKKCWYARMRAMRTTAREGEQ